jgi:hypothetical protein
VLSVAEAPDRPLDPKSAIVFVRVLGGSFDNDRKCSAAWHPSLPAIFLAIAVIVTGPINSAGKPYNRYAEQHRAKFAHESILHPPWRQRQRQRQAALQRQ